MENYSRSLANLRMASGIIDEIELSMLNTSSSSIRSTIIGIEELALSIRKRGLLQPVIVRPIIKNKFEIVAGNRRYNACKFLKLKKILCYVIDVDDREAFEIALIENVQRKSIDPIEEAEAYRKYVMINGWGSTSELAIKIGKSSSYVSKRISLGSSLGCTEQN